jgi:hypothetical protein
MKKSHTEAPIFYTRTRISYSNCPCCGDFHVCGVMLTNAIWRYTTSPARPSGFSWPSSSIGCNVCTSTGSLVVDESGTGAAGEITGEAGTERGLGDLGNGLYVSLSPPVVSGDRCWVAMVVRLKSVFLSHRRTRVSV